MSILRSKYINVSIVFITSMAMIMSYYLNIPLLSSFALFIQTTAALLAAFTLTLGAMNIAIITYREVNKRSKVAVYYVWMVLCIIVMFIAGLMPPMVGAPQFLWIYNNVQLPAEGTMYGSLALFVGAAVLRAFRARNKEALVMIIAGLFIIFMNAPIGDVIWSELPVIGRWIQNYPVSGASRGFNIALAVGSIGIAFRIILGHEKTASGET